MEFLQVKYLENESKLNSFLKRIQKKNYKINAIQYIPRTDCKLEGDRGIIKIDPIAVVQYWVHSMEE